MDRLFHLASKIIILADYIFLTFCYNRKEVLSWKKKNRICLLRKYLSEPHGEFVMKDLTNQYEIESRATSNWEHGNPIHQGTQRSFAVMAYPMMRLKTSLQISDQDFSHLWSDPRDGRKQCGWPQTNGSCLEQSTRFISCWRKCSRSMVHRRFWRDLFQSPERLSRLG